MNAFTSYRMFITPLSPVHIGTGESYEPTNYVIEDEVLHEFDTGSVVDALSASDRKALLDITSRQPDAEMIKGIQRYFHDRREQLIPWAVNRIPVLPGVVDLYARRIGQPANRETGGGQVLNRMEIDRTGYNPITRLPVLFGSSMKGAIRTALLDVVNNGKSAREKKGLHEFQGRLFEYLNDRGKPILELDPMRLVQLSDATWQGEPGLPAAQVYLAVNRKKSPVIDEKGKLRKSRVESGNGPDQILECISSWRYRAFAGQINLQNANGIPGQNEKGQRLLPAENLRFEVARIARACNDFYKLILESENKIMRERGYLDDAWGRSIEQFLLANNERMKRGEAFLLRVGRHSGAEAVTLNGVRDIKIMLGRDPDTGLNKSVNEPKARTLWLAADTKDQASKLLPFGWVLVELHPIDTSPQDWSELKSVCEPHLTSARAFAARLVAKQTEIEQARRNAEAKRLAEIEQERLRVEDEERLRIESKRQADEREAAIAKMNPVERSIHELLDQRVDKNQSAISAVTGAVKQGRWEGEDKITVAHWLKETMRETKKWREKSQKKHPGKDKDYQNTLLVMGWLEGK